jgi:hypothetical protein
VITFMMDMMLASNTVLLILRCCGGLMLGVSWKIAGLLQNSRTCNTWCSA